MPNHFHFLLQATSDSVLTKQGQLITQTELSDGFRQLLSSYAQAINKQENRTGSLFAQNTKAKLVGCHETKIDYSLSCLNYIHQNPVQASLVQVLKDWPYSSFPDYANFRNGTLCSKDIAYQLIDADWINFIQFSSGLLPEDIAVQLY
ncbi:transposase [Spirosoma arboris]|nr:transposase [Spirosoma arboris]